MEVREERTLIVIGIDPGVTTGYAEWMPATRRFNAVEGVSIHVAMWRVVQWHRDGELSHVVFEDARLRTWFGKASREQLQGAGSVKRDSKIWSDFLADAGIAFRALSPKEKGAKYDAAQFARLTGWQAKTNEHGRDAGMLVFGTNAMRSST
jgi:hypothetical protein